MSLTNFYSPIYITWVWNILYQGLCKKPILHQVKNIWDYSTLNIVESDPKHQMWRTLFLTLEGPRPRGSMYNSYTQFLWASPLLTILFYITKVWSILLHIILRQRRKQTHTHMYVTVVFRLTGFCLRSPCSHSARERKLSIPTQRGSCTRGTIIRFSQVIVAIEVVDALTLFPLPCTITSQSVQLLLTQLLQSLRGFGRQVWLDTRARDNKKIDEKRNFRGSFTLWRWLWLWFWQTTTMVFLHTCLMWIHVIVVNGGVQGLLDGNLSLV